MPVLIGWCMLAAAVLLVSVVVHASTFLGIDPTAQWPGVMFIHLAIFPPFIAAIYYANRTVGKESGKLDPVVNAAPLWLRIMAGVSFVYALMNFMIFVVLSEGGGPHERDGKYFLQSHGRVIRELTEDEFHRHQAYGIRGASGHWVLFSCASLMLLVGAAKLRRAGPAPVPAPPPGPAAAPAAADVAEQAETGEAAELPPEPTTARAGCVALVVYGACLAAIFLGRPALALAAALPVTLAMVLALRRRRGIPLRPFESCIGCLSVFPNALIAWRMGRQAADFIYVAISQGLGIAWRHEVTLSFPREGPAQLSNGELLDNRLWAVLMIFVITPLIGIGTIGLTYLTEHVGRLVEVRRRANNAGSQAATVGDNGA